MGRPPETDIVIRAKRGDADAYEALLRMHEHIAFRTAYAIVGSAADAEEVTQEAFVKAYAALPRFRTGSPFRPWLLRIVANEARNRRRTLGRRAHLLSRAADEAELVDAERIYRIDGKRKVVVAGTGARGHSGDGGPATAATLGGATGFDVDHDEKIAIAEYDNWIRVVDPAGSISTAAGNGGEGYAGDGGPAREALLGHPHDVLWRRDGVLVIADSHNGVLRRVDAAGRISTFASGLGAPVDVVGAPGDVIFVADAQRGVLRVAAEGGATTVVAYVPGAIGITVDASGNAYVSQLEARRVVRVTPAGRVTAVVVR